MFVFAFITAEENISKDQHLRCVFFTCFSPPGRCENVVKCYFFLKVIQLRQQAVAKRKENKHAVALDCDQVCCEDDNITTLV